MEVGNRQMAVDKSREYKSINRDCLCCNNFIKWNNKYVGIDNNKVVSWSNYM